MRSSNGGSFDPRNQAPGDRARAHAGRSCDGAVNIG